MSTRNSILTVCFAAAAAVGLAACGGGSSTKAPDTPTTPTPPEPTEPTEPTELQAARTAAK